TVALQFYAPGLLIFSLAKIFVPAFYARQDTRTPVLVGCCTVALNLALNVLFIIILPQPLKHAGLAAATVIAEGVYAVALIVILRRRIGRLGLHALVLSMIRCLLAAGVMAAAAIGLNRWLFGMATEFGLAAKPAQVVAVLGSILAAIVVYLALTIILRSPEWKEIVKALLRKK
ncbi:MAG: lipid II flippase MurJ, partial [Verrucomicrobiota bacterium]